MWVTANFSSSTFKPKLDRCMAADGTDVVLWATDRLLIRLGYQDHKWQISRHPATQPATDGRGRQGAFCWCGRFYLEAGEPIATLEDEAAPGDWDRIYRECLPLAIDGCAFAQAS